MTARMIDVLAVLVGLALFILLALACFGVYRAEEPPDDHETRMRKAVAWVRAHRLSTVHLHLPEDPGSVRARVLDTNGRIWTVELRCKPGEAYPLSSACEAQ